MAKEQTSYRISTTAKQLLALLATKLGLSQTAVIELAIRRLAEAEGVKVEVQK
jgi:biotin operon repressor